MLDIGWTELLLIGVVALIVVGPQDLPRMFHTLGRITARARSMAREFSSAMEDAARSSGIDDAANTLRDVKDLTSSRKMGLDALDRAADRFEKWDPKVPSARAPARPDPAQPDPVVPLSPDPAMARSPEAPQTAAPRTGAPHPALPDADAPAHGTPAPGRRQLKAVRRSDMKDD
ncbi:Sec-independent protein translocase protein TatB [Paracoccus jiaweipingae]|uniref:Sec-independent protein translocase protein TatB n=1 Tax=unclassified Paracoccus (in: a-proteobacteria) TaxID=2688777 RepID=UPI0037A2F02C